MNNNGSSLKSNEKSQAGVQTSRPLKESRGQQVRVQLPLVESSTQTDELSHPGLPPQYLSYGTDRRLQNGTFSHYDAALNSQFMGLHPHQFLTGEGPSMPPKFPDSSETLKPNNSIMDVNAMADSNDTNSSVKISDPGSTSFMTSLKLKLSCYVLALRPWSFPASITPVALGSCLAYKAQGMFDLHIFLTTVFTALCVHAAGNLVNTYFDFVRGIDNKKSDDRTLVDSILEPSNVVNLGALFYIAGCLGFLILNMISAAKLEHLALIYFCGLSSSFLYTGGLGLKYIAMGDILIVLTFGPLTVVFSYLTQTGQLSLIPLVYAIPLALNTEAILHCNNTRDMEGDKQAGAITMAILLGRSGSYGLFCFLLFMPYMLYITVGIHYSFWILLPAASIFIAFRLEKEFRRGKLETLPQKVAQLNLLMGVLYIISICMANSDSLPSMTQLS